MGRWIYSKTSMHYITLPHITLLHLIRITPHLTSHYAQASTKSMLSFLAIFTCCSQGNSTDTDLGYEHVWKGSESWISCWLIDAVEPPLMPGLPVRPGQHRRSTAPPRLGRETPRGKLGEALANPWIHKTGNEGLQQFSKLEVKSYPKEKGTNVRNRAQRWTVRVNMRKPIPIPTLYLP